MRGIYIGVDATNPTLILRIRSFLRAGVRLKAFTYRRQKFNAGYRPEWDNVHLGMTSDRNYLARLPMLLMGLLRMLAHARSLREADFIYARNIDLLFLGLFARWLTRSSARLIYEVEDVQEIFFKPTPGGRIFRALEGWALRRIDMLVPLSPGFMHGYFEPVHGYDGPHYVLENKIQLEGRPDIRTPAGTAWQGIRDRWVIGWFGTLRCPKSMRLLEEIAQRMSDRVEIYTRGYPTETGLDAYMQIVERNPNWVYDGEYTIPEDLEQMYGRVHFSWCLDFLDEHGNSPLLLACRMYQGGFYGAAPLVVKGWEMDRWCRRAGVGHAFEPPYVDQICNFLNGLDFARYAQARANMDARRHELFEEDGRHTREMLARILAL